MKLSEEYEVITHGGSDYGYKQCKCCKCGLVATCTPMFDYYPTGDGDNGPLQCENCLMREHFGKPNPPTIIVQ